MTSESKMILLFLIGCVVMQTINALPFDRFSREDDERNNEVSGEWFKKPILRLDRLFNSRESPSGSQREVIRPSRSDKAETTQSSKHAHSMITSMLGFVSSVINFGRSFVRDE